MVAVAVAVAVAVEAAEFAAQCMSGPARYPQHSSNNTYRAYTTYRRGNKARHSRFLPFRKAPQLT